MPVAVSCIHDSSSPRRFVTGFLKASARKRRSQLYSQNAGWFKSRPVLWVLWLKFRLIYRTGAEIIFVHFTFNLW